jgi:serine/threonine protein phosphatase PrpC
MTKGYRLTASTGIHKGDRDYQQDRVALLNHPRVNGCVLGIVADGMGGRSGGRKASDQVIMTAKQLFERYAPESDDASALLQQIAREAHVVIRLTAISAEEEPHSTVAAVLINSGGDCHWAHAGDSRVYHFHAGKLVRKTVDHSYVQLLVKRGEITEASVLIAEDIAIEDLRSVMLEELFQTLGFIYDIENRYYEGRSILSQDSNATTTLIGQDRKALRRLYP